MDILIQTRKGRSIIYDVKDLNLNGVELSITFNDTHTYKSIEEIQEILGLEIANYHFNHKDPYGNESDYGTDLIIALNDPIIIEVLDFQ